MFILNSQASYVVVPIATSGDQAIMLLPRAGCDQQAKQNVFTTSLASSVSVSLQRLDYLL